MKITHDFVRKIDDALMEHGVYAEVYRDIDYFGRDFLCIDISWGDWKHDHLRAKWVVEDVLGLDVMNWDTVVTEEDGSDCYSAHHSVWINV